MIIYFIVFFLLGGRRLDSDYKIIGNIASADLNIIIKPEDNGAIYVCKATNNATVRPLQTQIRLKVFCE